MSQIETMSKPEGPDGPRMYSEEIIVAPSKTNIEMANFETAVSATGFGKFNIFLLLVAIPSAMSPVFESSTMSYVLPVAQCDLNLTLQDKGILNAMGFGGMIASGLIWGYLCDTLGRKKLIMAGFLLDGFFILLSSTSQSFMFLMVVKFFGGFM
ncbi:unnamed protein product [Brassicogethes aeneus]|uniref:Major facilitator superfamily (MFS) profile domain-containing protein n=1 Tax=Brassicogethes aeneus TaxID=1431903 RepID=A0A9P0B3I6_BRAAE|nr:unnamed protein product [Brassicogethes aeneus]